MATPLFPRGRPPVRASPVRQLRWKRVYESVQPLLAHGRAGRPFSCVEQGRIQVPAQRCCVGLCGGARRDQPMASTAADNLMDILIDWGVEVIFGLPGDGINGLMEALRRRQDKIRFVHVRHEEA